MNSDPRYYNEHDVLMRIEAWYYEAPDWLDAPCEQDCYNDMDEGA